MIFYSILIALLGVGFFFVPYITLTLVLGYLAGEIFGYWIHRLLHSGEVDFLSRTHMYHHIADYGPQMKQRPTKEYINTYINRFTFLGIGLEWWIPVSITIGVLILIQTLLGIPAHLQAIFISTALGWGYLQLGLIHETFHVKNHWLAHHPWTKKYYRKLRKLHDIHHLDVNDDGKMRYNFGITTYWVDILFGTYKTHTEKLNFKGIEKLKTNYPDLFED